MANFSKHLTYGVSISGITSFIGHLYFGLNFIQAGAAMILGSLASLAPDLDHFKSVPGRILFDILGVLFPLIALQYVPIEYIKDFKLEHWIVYFFLGYFIIKVILYYIFNLLTLHRGIFHSLPAVLICGQVLFLIFEHFPVTQRIAIASIGMIGYLTHLIADECYSMDWNNNVIKKSFGSAIDLGNIKELSTWIAYAAIILLGGLIYQKTMLVNPYLP